MDIEEIKKLCSGNNRIPLEYRIDKKKTKELINFIIKYNIPILNKYIYVLLSYTNSYLIDKKEYIPVESIERLNETKETVDLEIEDEHNYVANGIIAHNTVNLPKYVKEDIVSDIYNTAYKNNLKGITVYRDGCRDNIFVNKDDLNYKNNNFKETAAPQRPKILNCNIIRFQNKGEKWVAIVGLLNSHPYEIFTGVQEKFQIPLYIENGKIVKNKILVNEISDETGQLESVKKSRYDFVYIDKNNTEQVHEGINAIFNPEYYNYAKLVSSVLRHGMPLEYVIKTISSLTFDNNSINSWKSGVIRALKVYLKDGLINDVCPKCGEKLYREAGCIYCKNPECGYAKCNG